MAGPWEKFQTQAPQPAPNEGPWTKFAQPQAQVMEPQAPQLPQGDQAYAGQNTDVPQVGGGGADFVNRVWGNLERQESGGRQNAISSKGAIGVAQVMPQTAREAASMAGLPFDEQKYKTDPNYNRALGQAYASNMFDRFGDDRLALAAYNAGPGRVQATIERYGDPSKGQISWDDFSSKLPQETQDYVAKILPPVPNKYVEAAKEVGRVVDTGLKQGIRAVADIPATMYRGAEELINLPYQAINRVTGEDFTPRIPGLENLPTPGQLLQSGVQRLTAPIQTPETEGGKAASNILGATVAGAIPLTRAGATVPAILEGAGMGASAGVGSEVAAKAFGDSDLARAVGGLGAAGAYGVTRALSNTNATRRLAREALEGVTDEQLAVAKQVQEAARKQGVQLTLAQSIPGPSNARFVEEVLANTPAGSSLARAYRQQPAQVEAAARQFQHEIPGEVKPQSVVANEAQEAASNAIQGYRDWRTSQTRPYYAASGNISPEHARKIIKDLKSLAAQFPNTPKGQYIDDLANDLVVSKPIYKNGERIGTKQTPILDINKINGVLKAAAKGPNRLNQNSQPYDNEALGFLSRTITGPRQELGEVSPAFAEANKMHRALTETVINPVTQGPLGRVSGRTGYQAGQAANPNTIFKIFDEGTPVSASGRSAQSPILTLQSQMSSVGRDGAKAFADTGATWLARGLDKALQIEGGQLSPGVAKNIEQQFFSSPNKIQGFNDVMAGMARSQGIPEQDFVTGARNFMQTIQRAAITPGKIAGTTTGGINEAAASRLQHLGRFTILQPLRQPALFLSGLVERNSTRTISDLMTTPEGIDTLRKLARVEPGSPAAIKALSTFAAIRATQDQNEGGQ